MFSYTSPHYHKKRKGKCFFFYLKIIGSSVRENKLKTHFTKIFFKTKEKVFFKTYIQENET